MFSQEGNPNPNIKQNCHHVRKLHQYCSETVTMRVVLLLDQYNRGEVCVFSTNLKRGSSNLPNNILKVSHFREENFLKTCLIIGNFA